MTAERRSNRPDGSWRARPTIYKGIPMRSRLEALWAAQFDSGGYVAREDDPGFRWTYEPVCFADGRRQYLPDFGLTHGHGLVEYAEVKPSSLSAASLHELQNLMEVVWWSVPAAQLCIFVGSPDEAVCFEGTFDGGWHAV